MSIRSSADLSVHLEDAESSPAGDLAKSEKVVEKLMSKWPNERGIFVQLRRLADYITKTRHELSTLRPDQVKKDFLPKATDELDAIVEATASATHRIMDAADVIMEIAGRVGGADGAKATAAVTSIYEACTFQDITGQRVTKVVNVLKVIEDRVDRMISAMGEVDLSALSSATEGAGTPTVLQNEVEVLFFGGQPASSQKSQLHGPALPGQGQTQDEIDALFGG